MSIEALLTGARPPGRYRLAGSERLSRLRRSADAAAWWCGVTDGRRMPDRAGLFDDFAAALAFPTWFGANWDAFADCLQDLSWLPGSGVMLLWNHPSAANRDVREKAEDVIDAAIETRVELRLPPLYLVYAGPRGGVGADVARLAAR